MRILASVFFCAALLVGSFLLLDAYNFLGNSVAVVDVNKLLNTGAHSVEALRINKQAKEIYQYNLDVIEKKLSTYKNKQQAQLYLREAARQLQQQLNTTHAATLRAMGTVIKHILDGYGNKYDVIVDKGSVLANTKSVDITDKVFLEFASAGIEWPPLPRKIDTPNLPADKPVPPAPTNDKAK